MTAPDSEFDQSWGNPSALARSRDGDQPVVRQYAVQEPGRDPKSYGDQDYVKYGDVLRDSEDGARIVYRDISLTYGPWVDQDAGAEEVGSNGRDEWRPGDIATAEPPRGFTVRVGQAYFKRKFETRQLNWRSADGWVSWDNIRAMAQRDSVDVIFVADESAKPDPSETPAPQQETREVPLSEARKGDQILIRGEVRASGTATVRGVEGVRVFRTDAGEGRDQPAGDRENWCTATRVVGAYWHADVDLADFVPDGEK